MPAVTYSQTTTAYIKTYNTEHKSWVVEDTFNNPTSSVEENNNLNSMVHDTF